MKINEPITALRVVAVRLTKDSDDGNGPQGIAGQGGGVATVQIAPPGGNYGSTSATLVEITGGGVVGDYTLNLATTDVNAKGKWRVLITGAAIDPFPAYYEVEPLDCLLYATVTNVSDTTHFDVASAVATDFYYAKASVNRVCVVRVIDGAGAGQCRLVINSLATNHRFQVDEAFAVGLDTTSVVRLEQCITAPALATDVRFTHLDADISTRATVATILSGSLGSGHTVLGALRRMDWLNIAKSTGLYSALVSVTQYDGTTAAWTAVQDPVGGSRQVATSVQGDV